MGLYMRLTCTTSGRDAYACLDRSTVDREAGADDLSAVWNVEHCRRFTLTLEHVRLQAGVLDIIYKYIYILAQGGNIDNKQYDRLAGLTTKLSAITSRRAILGFPSQIHCPAGLRYRAQISKNASEIYFPMTTTTTTKRIGTGKIEQHKHQGRKTTRE